MAKPKKHLLPKRLEIEEREGAERQDGNSKPFYRLPAVTLRQAAGENLEASCGLRFFRISRSPTARTGV